LRLSGGHVAALAVIASACGLALAAGEVTFAFSSDPIGPRGFPYAIAAALGLCGLWYLAIPGEAEAPPGRRAFRSIGAFLALAVATTWAMPAIGFIVAMVILVGGMATLFGARPVQALAGAVCQSVLWWAIFGPLLGGNLPAGPWGF
jgi:putative tricarboxylic transport membrane protein